jgi:hypothetical protein
MQTEESAEQQALTENKNRILSTCCPMIGPPRDGDNQSN